MVKMNSVVKKAPTRFELVTSSLLDWRSNQLSYGAALFIFANLLLLSLAANIYCHLDCLIDFER